MDHDLLRKMRESVKNIRTADRPPQGDSWIDYATRHQHAGSRPCWQCAARDRALAEHRELAERIAELELDLAALDTPEGASVLCERHGFGDILPLNKRIAELEAEVARLRELIPVECCSGSNPHCYGPRGCLVRAEKADTTPNDVLVARIEDLTTEVAKARAEEREAIVQMIDDARIETLHVAEDRCNIIRIIRNRAQEGSDG